MTDADRQRFAQVLLMITETYKDKFSAPRAELYFQSLRRFEIDDIERALPVLIADPTRKFSPKPSDFVETIEGTPTDRALRSATRVEAAANNVGPYHSVTFGADDEGRVIHALIEHMGGWVAFCNKLGNEKERPFVLAEFTKLHRLFEKSRPNVVMTHLPGIFEITNRATRGSWDHGLEHQEHLHVIDRHGQSSERRHLQINASPDVKPARVLPPHEPEPEGPKSLPQATKELLDRWKKETLDSHNLRDTVERHKPPELDSGETFFEGKEP